MPQDSEKQRLQDDSVNWKQWGPYLSERAWGTVREDYSANGEAWTYFPHEYAQSKTYRWGEDGLAGISDERQYLCFGLALWNGQDAILKERLFGLTGKQGNHGEDVKEYYYYLDNTPTHSYMKMLYKYPQQAFPYEHLVSENQQRGFEDDEYELCDTGIFDDNRYFELEIDYAKAEHNDILIRIKATNRSAEDAPLTLLPTLWFRNTWSWGYEHSPMQDVAEKPTLSLKEGVIIAEHCVLGTYYLYSENADNIIFTENESNNKLLYGSDNDSPYVKDAFHRYIVNDETSAINPDNVGTKASPVFKRIIGAGETETIHLRLSATAHKTPFETVETVFNDAIASADDFYDTVHSAELTKEEKRIQRLALAGMLWTKQLYYYDVEQWLDGDPNSRPPQKRKKGRNNDWKHLNNFSIISMPDKWEYPWYAVWDSAFHCIPLAMVDLDFAKDQLILLTREWYLHPNGQLPAYEWNFSDVNPPVHAWAAWHVYQMDGCKDKKFLKRIFNKMLLNFTWWVNRKDEDDNNIFQGGFLGLDNISLFDRSEALPNGGYVNQSDGTAWMGFFSLTMFNIAIELAKHDDSYSDMTVKFYEHFLQIAHAMSGVARDGTGLWDDEDGFYYDAVHLQNGDVIPLKIRSLVGLLPLIAVMTVGEETLETLPELSRSIDWLKKHRPEITENLLSEYTPEYGRAHIFAIARPERLRRVLGYMLDEDEFLSDYGIRSLSKHYENNPYEIDIAGKHFSIEYWEAESRNGLFGGNSNWRGPIWFPINYLLIEALRIHYRYYGDDFTVECPTGSGNEMTLNQVADELAQRLTRLFLKNEQGQRPFNGENQVFQNNDHWQDHILFHEYFNGNTGEGLGASHQTGWTGLIAELLQQVSDK
ncbi:MAG: glucosidase [Phototrophicaceae bacterium]